MTIRLNHFKTRLVRYPLLALATLAFAVSLGNAADLSKSDWASWVQAIGSITALGVAIYVMSRQNAHSARLLVEADLRRAMAVLALLERCKFLLHHFRTQLVQLQEGPISDRECDLVKLIGVRLSEMRQVVATIPTHELGNYKMASSTLQMLDLVGNYGKVLALIESDLPDFEPESTKLAIRSLELEIDIFLHMYREGMAEID